MKRLIIIMTAAMLTSVAAFSQKKYQYVVIPLTYSDFGKTVNPYSIATSLQNVLNLKGIKTVSDTDSEKRDCTGLVAAMDKTSNMFTNKLVVKFLDCRNNVVWSNEGVGRAKEYPQGYAQAIAHALQNFTELPDMPANADGKAEPQPVPDTKKTELYFNDDYIFKLTAESDDVKKLEVISGDVHGVKLTVTAATGIFSVEWTKKNGDIQKGIAELKASQISIKFSSGDTLTLQKK
ncbi:MAG: hypothetical protein LBR06_03580 [Bacteroidales bacterium]|nr:hypothetical protein [Bacteroidales bacterium]